MEFLYGTWAPPSLSACTTSPKAESDLLMCCASFRRSPVASDFATRSDPARSTRYNTPRVAAPVSTLRPSTRTHTTEWLRLERRFIAVAPVARIASPSAITAATSSAVRTGRYVASGALDPEDAPWSFTSTVASADAASKSRHRSL